MRRLLHLESWKLKKPVHFKHIIPRTFLAIVTGFALLSFFLSMYGLYLERHRLASGYGDFIIFYTGAQILRDGKGSDLYDLALQQKYQDRFDVQTRQGAVLPFNHPPFELLWHLPPSYLDYSHAYLFWCAVNLLLLIALGRYLVPLNDKRLAIMFWAMIFGFYPVGAALMQAQDSLLLTFLIVASMSALKNGREIAAGIILAFGLFKPQFVLLFALVFLVQPYRKAFVAWTATATLLTAISVAIVGIDGALKYFELLTWMDSAAYTIVPERMANLRGFVHSALAFDFPGAVTPTLLILSGLVVVWTAHLWRSRPKEEDSCFDLKVAFTTTVAVLTSYHAYPPDLSIMLIPILILVRLSFEGVIRDLSFLYLFLFVLILWIPFPVTWLRLFNQNQLAWGSLLFIGLLCLTAVELEHCRRASWALKS